MIVAKRREDILLSICCAEFRPDDGAVAELRRVAAELAARYRYWEILLLVDADVAQDFEPLMRDIANIRLLKVRHGTPFYRRRVAAASEAIGDVVVLAAVEEFAVLDVFGMIERASATGAIVVGKRGRASLTNPLLRALGRGAGFRVSSRDMLTIVYPRTLLNQLLAHPDRQLALRFAPADSAIPIQYQASADHDFPRRSLREFGRRMSLIQKLLVSAAPRVLTVVSVFSLIVMVAAAMFGLYAIVVWLTLSGVQPGWFTTSIALSLTAAFLGGAIFGLSIGLQKMIEVLSPDVTDDIMDERSAVDLFGQVMQELNVEIGSDAPPEPPRLAPVPATLPREHA